MPAISAVGFDQFQGLGKLLDEGLLVRQILFDTRQTGDIGKAVREIVAKFGDEGQNGAELFLGAVKLLAKIGDCALVAAFDLIKGGACGVEAGRTLVAFLVKTIVFFPESLQFWEQLIEALRFGGLLLEDGDVGLVVEEPSSGAVAEVREAVLEDLIGLENRAKCGQFVA